MDLDLPECLTVKSIIMEPFYMIVNDRYWDFNAE